MKILVTGAGQIAQALVTELIAHGHTASVVSRSRKAWMNSHPVEFIMGDVLTLDSLDRLVKEADAVVHTIHAPYYPDAWRAELPQREIRIMDAAARAAVPVIFPESVYAFGVKARNLREDDLPAPTTPLGQIRAELLSARQAHSARTASVVASDLYGPTANAGSVLETILLSPLRAGKRGYGIASVDQPHAFTYLPDYARAIRTVTEGMAGSDNTKWNDEVILAPSQDPLTLREISRMASDVLRIPSLKDPIVVPVWALYLGGLLSKQTRSIAQQSYLFSSPVIMQPGQLGMLGLSPTPWAVSLPAVLAQQTPPSITNREELTPDAELSTESPGLAN